MTKTVVGIFEDATAAENAFQRLSASGFRAEEIDITTQPAGYTTGADHKTTDHSDDDFGDRVSRFFKNLFDDEDESDRFSQAARTGSVLSVYADSMEKAQRAADILDEAGAIDIDRRESTTDMSTEGRLNRASSDVERGDHKQDNSSDRSIPIVEEELHIGKREVETGGVRVRSRIIDRPVEEHLRLRQERVSVERTPANRPATESDLNTFRDGEIEVREREEIPVVNKEARVVEEINVRKDVSEREEVVRDTVRKTDVEVDDIQGNDSVGNKRPRKKV